MIKFKFLLCIITFAIILLDVGCSDINWHGEKFTKALWDSTGDLNSHPERESVLYDLIKNHQIKGLTYHQVINLLGEPENYGDTKDSIYYNITVNYGYLDPKSGKRLDIGFNRDSIATGFNVVEWKNRHANE